MTSKFAKRFLLIFLPLLLLSAAVVFFMHDKIYLFWHNVYGVYIPFILTASVPAILCAVSLLAAKLTVGDVKIFRTDKIGLASDVVIIVGCLILAVFLAMLDINTETLKNILDYPEFLITYLGAFLLLALLLILLNDIIQKMVRQRKEDAGKANRWANVSMLSVILVSMVFVCVGVMLVNYGAYRENYLANVESAFALYALLTIVSVGAIALIVKMWKPAIAVSIFAALIYIILSVFIGVVGLEMIYDETLDYSRMTSKPDSHYLLGSNTSSDDDYGVDFYGDDGPDEEYYEEEGYYDEEEVTAFNENNAYSDDMEVEPISFWAKDKDSTNMEQALEYMKDNMSVANLDYSMFDKLLPYVDNYQTWYGSGLPDTEGRTAYDHVVRYLNVTRDNSTIRGVFMKFWPLAVKVFSVDEYSGGGYERLVTQLINAYNDLYDSENQYYNFYLVYKLMTDGEYYGDELADAVMNYASKESLSTFSDSEVGRIIWVYSFWARRANEGCARAVYLTLNQIAEHYSNQ